MRDLFSDLVEYLRAAGVVVITQYYSDGPCTEIEGCDGSDRVTRTWASLRGIDLNAVETFLESLHCSCDCDIVARAEEMRRTH